MSPPTLLSVPISKLHANEWNHNKVSPDKLAKIRVGLKEYKAQTGTYLPLLCRPHPKQKGEYQIVDGEHRWKICRDEFREKELPVIVTSMSDALARKMTVRTNYLHGDPDPDKYAEILSELVKEGESLAELAMALPEDEEELKKILNRKGFEAELAAALAETEATAKLGQSSSGKTTEPNAYVDLRFTVPLEAAEIIEREITRIADFVGGKNSRARALEYMAVQSSQTPLPGQAPKPMSTKLTRKS